MFEFIYQPLTNLGYNHPIHPTLTHVPIGMAMGAFIFVLIAVITRKKNLAQTARHCSVLALIGPVPTALLGLMDWQHFYGGLLLFPIKMVFQQNCSACHLSDGTATKIGLGLKGVFKSR
jgi:uncharacterized membrane protein